MAKLLDVRRAAHLSLLVLVFAFFGLNVWHSYDLGQAETMYDNPIYRWRESMAIALSRMQPVPARGYVAYRSIRNYLNHHGLALMEGEARPLPTAKQRHDLIFDPPRIEKLLQEASRADVNRSLPPVVLKGNEKGLADYYYFAFELFGIHLLSLWLFYFLLLGIAVVLFAVTFRNSPFCLMLLLFYLAGHLVMIEYAQHPYFVTVHNSRFLPVLALLPSIYLLLLLVRRERASVPVIGMAIAQLFLACFVVYCRVEAVWELMAIVACSVTLFPWRALLESIWQPRVFGRVAGAAALSAWPGSLTVTGLIAISVYGSVALDRHAYATETKTHVFWHTMYAGTVSASPQLRALYLRGDDAFGDNVSYDAVLAYLRARNDAHPEIAYVSDGVIYINPMKNMGVYDGLVRRVFFELFKQHPWLVLKSFVYDKPREQIEMLGHIGFFRAKNFRWMALLSLLAVGAAFVAGAPIPRRHEILQSAATVVTITPFALLTTLIVPSTLIVDSILATLILLLLVFIYLPAAGLYLAIGQRWQRAPQIAEVDWRP